MIPSNLITRVRNTYNNNSKRFQCQLTSSNSFNRLKLLMNFSRLCSPQKISKNLSFLAMSLSFNLFISGTASERYDECLTRRPLTLHAESVGIDPDITASIGEAQNIVSKVDRLINTSLR